MNGLHPSPATKSVTGNPASGASSAPQDEQIAIASAAKAKGLK